MNTKQVWTDQRIRDRVKARMKKYQAQGADAMTAEAIAYSAVCQEMRDEYEALLLKLNREYAALELGATAMAEALR